MSSTSLPITPSSFATAIKELPLSALYSKAVELHNSIGHLERSNAELRAFLAESCDSEGEKKELEGYVTENEEVIASMKERIAMLKIEVENRGQVWVELEELKVDDGGGNQQQQPETPVTNGEDGEDGVYL